LVTIGEAQRFYLLPKAAAAKQKRSMFGGPPHVAIVNTIIPGSPARGKLKLGDIVYSVDGKAFGENLAKYTRSLNAALGAPEAPEPHNAKVSLGVYVQPEHLYNIQCSEIFTQRNEKLHTEA
jgi:hypothetical protein